MLEHDEQSEGDGVQQSEGDGEGDGNHRAPVPIRTRCGDVLVFSSKLWHCSGENQSEAVRRVYYAQFSKRPVVDRRGRVLCFAVGA